MLGEKEISKLQYFNFPAGDGVYRMYVLILRSGGSAAHPGHHHPQLTEAAHQQRYLEAMSNRNRVNSNMARISHIVHILVTDLLSAASDGGPTAARGRSSNNNNANTQVYALGPEPRRPVTIRKRVIYAFAVPEVRAYFNKLLRGADDTEEAQE